MDAHDQGIRRTSRHLVTPRDGDAVSPRCLRHASCSAQERAATADVATRAMAPETAPLIFPVETLRTGPRPPRAAHHEAEGDRHERGEIDEGGVWHRAPWRRGGWGGAYRGVGPGASGAGGGAGEEDARRARRAPRPPAPGRPPRAPSRRTPRRLPQR